MLADQVAAWCDGLGKKAFGDGAKRLQKDIYAAVRFELAPSLIQSTDAITRAPIRQRLEVMSMSKFPFRDSWFEWEGSAPAYRITARQDVNVPTRVGVLVKCDASHQRGLCTWVWSFGRELINLCIVATSFDWSENPQDIPSFGYLPSKEEAELTAQKCDKGFIKNASEEEFKSYCGRLGFGPSPYWMDALERIAIKNNGKPPEGFKAVWDQNLLDIKGEPELLYAAIVILNSKNLTKTEQIDVDYKVNKKRKLMGRPPLLSYRTVNINLSRAMLRRASDGAPGPGVRAHVVRGHFKIRKSGIYWWAPFIRGDKALGVVQKTSYGVSP